MWFSILIFLDNLPEAQQEIHYFISQDPDFQGDPINNMNNTNLDTGGREGDWAGIMSR